MSAAMDRLWSMWAEAEIERTGYAAQALWTCSDGWIVGYTTERVKKGPYDRKFVAMAYKPLGKGARTGKAESFKRVYIRAFAKRKTAKARAEALYEQHSKR